jgi:hypothetical protein
MSISKISESTLFNSASYALDGGEPRRSWLRHCATNREIAGWIPHCVTEIFHWRNPSGPTTALESTQPLTEMSKVKCSRYRPDWPREWTEVQLYHLLTSALEGGGWSAPRPGRFSPGKDPVPIVQKAEWAPGSVWTCAKNLAPTWIRSPDRPARSQSRYRQSSPAHRTEMSTRGISWGVKASSISRLSWNLGSWNSWNHLALCEDCFTHLILSSKNLNSNVQDCINL